jgi:hypothetical protein
VLVYIASLNNVEPLESQPISVARSPKTMSDQQMEVPSNDTMSHQAPSNSNGEAIFFSFRETEAQNESLMATIAIPNEA